MFNNIYRNKKVLITGHTGFKGSWLCLMLSYLNSKIHGYALKPEKRSLFNEAKRKTIAYAKIEVSNYGP